MLCSLEYMERWNSNTSLVKEIFSFYPCEDSVLKTVKLLKTVEKEFSVLNFSSLNVAAHLQLIIKVFEQKGNRTTWGFCMLTCINLALPVEGLIRKPVYSKIRANSE